MNETTYIPEFLGITLSSLQVFFPLLAIVLSLVNCFTNQNQNIAEISLISSRFSIIYHKFVLVNNLVYIIKFKVS